MEQRDFEKLCRRVARGMGIRVTIINGYDTYDGSIYDLNQFKAVAAVLAEEFDCSYSFK